MLSRFYRCFFVFDVPDRAGCVGIVERPVRIQWTGRKPRDLCALSGEVSIKFGGQQASGKARDLKRDGEKLTFTADLAGAVVHFVTMIGPTKLRGTFEAFEKEKRTVVGAFCASRAGSPACGDADIPAIPNLPTATQRADETFDTSVAQPAYRSNGPRVLFDEAHKNFHRSTKDSSETTVTS